MFVKALIPLFKVYLAYLKQLELCPQFDSGFRHHQRNLAYALLYNK